MLPVVGSSDSDNNAAVRLFEIYEVVQEAEISH